MFVAPARSTAYNFATDAQAILASPPDATNKVVYHLAAYYPGRAPAGIDWRPHDGDLATVHALYRSQDISNSLVSQCSFAEYTPDQSFFSAWCANWNLPAHVTELYSPAPGVLWGPDNLVFSATDEFPAFDGEFLSDFLRLAKGSVTSQTWNSAVAGPSLDSGGLFAFNGVQRTGDDLIVVIPLFAPADRGSVVTLGNNLTATGSTTLKRGGTVIGSDPTVLGDEFTLPAAPAWYTLSVTGQRVTTWSRLSTKVSAVWRFRSGHVDFAVLPLPMVKATGAFDDYDRAPARATFRLDLTPSVATGA